MSAAPLPNSLKPTSSVRAASINAAAAKSAERSVLRLPVLAYAIGLVGILIALVSSGGLAYQHLSGHPLPGCGGGNVTQQGMGLALTAETKQSACATLEAHPMGSIGGMVMAIKSIASSTDFQKINPLQAVWPVSFLGATYFAAALAAWIVIGVRGRSVPALIPWLARFGAALSILYIVVIIATNKLCPYCIASHIGNLTLWLALEIGMIKARSVVVAGWKWDRAWSAVVAGVAVFAICSGTLAAFEVSHREGLMNADAEAAAKSRRELEEAMRQAADKAAAQAMTEKAPWGLPNGFRGRWLLGPKESTVRVVMLTDFQCPDCKAFENQLMAAYNANPGKISISIVHFPMCKDCNPHVGSTMHVNACEAARAAEAVASVAGSIASLDGKPAEPAANEAFFKMAEWLFSITGDFKEADLRAQVTKMGIPNVEAVIKKWKGEETLKLVQDDAKWGEVLGLFYTPMMFVNGVEVRGWLTNPMMLTSMINDAIKINPAPADAKNDNPPLVGMKYFEDWKLAPRVRIPEGNAKYVKKQAGAKVDVVVWGDLTEPGTKELDLALQGMIGKKSFNYAFRHYPVCTDCNPGVDNKYPAGCIAAQAVEAAGNLGGVDAWNKMKGMIFDRQAGLTKSKLSLFAGVIGLETAKFDAEIDSGPVKVAVENDVMAGKGYVTRFIPTIFVDGKVVDRWKRDGDNVLERILDYAQKHPGE